VCVCLSPGIGVCACHGLRIPRTRARTRKSRASENKRKRDMRMHKIEGRMLDGCGGGMEDGKTNAEKRRRRSRVIDTRRARAHALRSRRMRDSQLILRHRAARSAWRMICRIESSPPAAELYADFLGLAHVSRTRID
jgi:hypothetical protein